MARLGLLPIEEETGRWHNIPRAERWCAHCPGVLGTSQHFLRGCTHLTSDIVPPWLECESREAAGAWWRRTARLLELRWREKRAIHSGVPRELDFLVDVSAGYELDVSALTAQKPHFLEPGSGPPPGLSAELFTDGSKRPECAEAGWGLWAVFLDSATGVPTGILEAQGRVAEAPHTNMTAELSALRRAFAEIQTLEVGAACLLRFDCIPALMLAVGCYRPKQNVTLVQEIHSLYLEVRAKYTLYFMHAKGHAGMFGNEKADSLADSGAEHAEALYSYLTLQELGGSARFSERYVPGDCGLDADLERKYAGRQRARKTRAAQGVESGHVRAIRNHLRHLGIQGTKAASILVSILDPAQNTDTVLCARSTGAATIESAR